MAGRRSTGDREDAQLSRRLVSVAKKPLLTLSQEADFGVLVEQEAGIPIEPTRTLDRLWLPKLSHCCPGFSPGSRLHGRHTLYVGPKSRRQT